jgi:GNAT superfamily N-acetyltransferase
VSLGLPGAAGAGDREGVPTALITGRRVTRTTLAGVEIDDDKGRIDVDLVHRELAASYWSPGVPRPVVAAAIAGSDCWGAYDGVAMVGFARLVTDRATFGWIADVVVVAERRGAGVGRALVAAAVARAASYGLRRLMLATRDAHELYRRFGFTDPPAGLLMERTVDPARLYST